jgi:hypothetical protein
MDPAFVERQRQQQALEQSRAAMAPFAPTDPAYRVNPDGTLSFDPQRLLNGLRGAQEAGVIDPAEVQRLLPLAAQAQQAAQDRARFVANDTVASKLKAFGYGAGKGALFLAGAVPGTEVGLATGPFAPVAAPVFGAITGGTTVLLADQVIRKLGQYSETVKSFTDAADYHPGYDAAGNLVAIMAGSPGSIANLARTGVAMKAVGAPTGTVVQAIGARIVGSAAANAAVDTAIQEGARALGYQQQGQTLGGVLQAAAIGAFLSGHRMKIGGYTPKEVAAAVVKARAGQALTAEETNINNAFIAALKNPAPGAGPMAPARPVPQSAVSAGMPANSPSEAIFPGPNAGRLQGSAGDPRPAFAPPSDAARRLPPPFGDGPAANTAPAARLGKVPRWAQSPEASATEGANADTILNNPGAGDFGKSTREVGGAILGCRALQEAPARVEVRVSSSRSNTRFGAPPVRQVAESSIRRKRVARFSN